MGVRSSVPFSRSMITQCERHESRARILECIEDDDSPFSFLGELEWVVSSLLLAISLTDSSERHESIYSARILDQNTLKMDDSPFSFLGELEWVVSSVLLA